MVVISSTSEDPMQGVLFHSPATTLFINDKELGTAALFVTEHNVLWGGALSDPGTTVPTFSILYSSIAMHAVQKDPTPALYLVLNYELRIPALTVLAPDYNGEDEDDEFEADDHPITQLRLIPQTEQEVHAMFAAMNQGQALNPDTDDEVDQDADQDMGGEDDDDEFEDAEEMGAQEAVDGLQKMRIDNGANFEDCEDDDD